MRIASWPRIAMCAFWLAGSGCTAVREIPRNQYGTKPERQNVRVTTTEGLVYEFDHARVEGDSLVGWRRRDLGVPGADYVSFALPLSDIKALAARGVDWQRTALIGGGVVVAVAAAGLARKDKPSGSGDGNGGGGRVP